jgi:tRNA G18 (ribose-2'-O)-methylase SpoU|tara:strand:- start:307 stop:840 length:534 start_codon:yes stop_codon:yes gene_type:complete
MRKLKNTELNRKSIEEFKKADKTPAIVVLDNIRSIHNVGSIFRSSDSFLIKKVYICGITATPENQRMAKTALGSTDSVDWEYVKESKELIKKLEKDNIIIVSVEQADKSIKIQDFNPANKSEYAFVFGNEVDGVREEFIKASKHVLEIPQVGTKHSLNVSVAAGIVLWDFYQKSFNL